MRMELTMNPMTPPRFASRSSIADYTGGFIHFKFGTPISKFLCLGIVDIETDSPDNVAWLLDSSGGIGDNAYQEVSLHDGSTGISELMVDTTTSGAITDVAWCGLAEPEPTGSSIDAVMS
uniref:Uncharacterized protein n=1 Tax=Grammatophora oceanica TaxID=210454 RepID=A0A7S1VNT0_9STRA|mmetsp:Transcript_51845/g.77403  ORF Transcript_51845/g.77403 Transcript_51845/m.77403 type:complete len:120 (+) Transcript_51845:974-1333(+)